MCALPGTRPLRDAPRFGTAVCHKREMPMSWENRNLTRHKNIQAPNHNEDRSGTSLRAPMPATPCSCHMVKLSAPTTRRRDAARRTSLVNTEHAYSSLSSGHSTTQCLSSPSAHPPSAANGISHCARSIAHSFSFAAVSSALGPALELATSAEGVAAAVPKRAIRPSWTNEKQRPTPLGPKTNGSWMTSAP